MKIFKKIMICAIAAFAFSAFITVSAGAAGVSVPIYANEGGKVLEASYLGDAGYTVLIEQADGVISAYKHCAENLSVHKGETVKRGEKLGNTGHSGRAFGTYLSVDLFKDGASVNSDYVLETGKNGYEIKPSYTVYDENGAAIKVATDVVLGVIRDADGNVVKQIRSTIYVNDKYTIPANGSFTTYKYEAMPTPSSSFFLAGFLRSDYSSDTTANKSVTITYYGANSTDVTGTVLATNTFNTTTSATLPEGDGVVGKTIHPTSSYTYYGGRYDNNETSAISLHLRVVVYDERHP